MGSNIYLGKPSAGIIAWIKEHIQPQPTPAHAETWYKYTNDTSWRTINIEGEIAIVDNNVEPTGQIENPLDIVAIEIGSNVTSIAISAFKKCNALTSVAIPESVKTIDSNAFNSCSNLANVSIAQGVENINSYAFANCTNLASIQLPDGLKGITMATFYDCEKLSGALVIPDSVTAKIGMMAFYNCGITSVVIGSGITGTSQSAFSGCSNLKSAVIGNNVTNIGSTTFQNCTNLESITIPDSVKTISRQAFLNCTNVKSVTIVANGGNAEDVKQKMINTGVPSTGVTWNMPS